MNKKLVSFLYASLAAVLTITLLASVLPVKAQTAELSTVSLRAQLEPHSNEFLAKDGWFETKLFDMTATNFKELCPTSNCSFSIEKGEFRPDTYTHGYTYDGQIKAAAAKEGGGKVSKFTNMRADLTKSGSEETPGGTTTETLDGDINFGKSSFLPSDLTYKITNSTLEIDGNSRKLTINAQK